MRPGVVRLELRPPGFANPAPPRRKRRPRSPGRPAPRKRVASVPAEVIHAARWDMMAMSVAALAHEINQPLTAIGNFLEAARYSLAAGEADAGLMRDVLSQATRQARQAGAIVRNLREFIDKRETDRRFEAVNQVVEDAIQLGVAGLRESNASIARDFGEGLPPVLINRVEIQQVLLNLFRNAFQAMGEAGERRLTVKTAADSAFVRVSVSDTGQGIDPVVLARLFQPFATTKREGMGLGLRICQSIVEAHEGRIWVTRNEDVGTSFHFRLPADDVDGLD